MKNNLVSSSRNSAIRIIGSVTLAIVICVSAYAAYEPMIADASGQTASDSVIVTLNVDEGISITSPSDTTMSNSLGVVVNSAIATTTWNVKTNAAAGYNLKLTSGTNPAMKSGSVGIPDFTGGSSSTPATWNNIPGSTYQFGFSGFSTTTGSPVSSGTWGADTNCGATSTPSTVLKYAPFTTGTPPISLATRSSTTTTAGDNIVVCYAVQQNGAYAPSGVYIATITATATTL